MKTRNLFISMIAFAICTQANAQENRDLQFWRPVDKRGVNVFETPKADTIPYDGVKVRLGGDFALQFQGLSQSNTARNLVNLSNNFTLPTANLNLDVQLADGLRMHLRTYLSSRHHPETYVKGGYIQIDKLDFISEGFLEELMNVATIRIGMDQINYGDAQFRRSDNAMALYNPFVGNYIMDSFTTEPFVEVTVQSEGWLGVIGATNGRLNQTPTSGDNGFAAYAKAGYDKQITDDFRFRLTASVYNSTEGGTRDYIYGGDRAGARYYSILIDTLQTGTDFEARFNPGFQYQTAIQVNPFIKYGGLEFFGIYELSSGDQNSTVTVGEIPVTATNGGYTQLAAELLYRFGRSEQFYIGGRYNQVTGKDNDLDATETKTIERYNIGGGWFMTPNIVAKLEYVDQTYSGAGFLGKYTGAEFSGIMFEAAISF